jgi:hypothetical protein
MTSPCRRQRAHGVGQAGAAVLHRAPAPAPQVAQVGGMRRRVGQLRGAQPQLAQPARQAGCRRSSQACTQAVAGSSQTTRSPAAAGAPAAGCSAARPSASRRGPPSAGWRRVGSGVWRAAWRGAC